MDEPEESAPDETLEAFLARSLRMTEEEFRTVGAMSREEAEAAEKDWKYDASNPRAWNPQFKWLVTQRLKDLYQAHRNGEVRAVLDTLHYCLANSLPIPQWCAKAYVEAYEPVRRYEARTWDDVFGPMHKKGTHLYAKQQEEEKSYEIYCRIEQLHQYDPKRWKDWHGPEGWKKVQGISPGAPIDATLFERVGKEFGVGKTVAEEYYYKWKTHSD
jgi:hypothetical protein